MTCSDVIVAGLDLAASERRCSGIALLCTGERRFLRVGCASSDDEILSATSMAKVVAIDAPLSESPSMREVDRKMISMGFRLMPPSLGSMRALTERGWRLYLSLSRLGVRVVETHPRSALKSAGVESVEELASLLGLSGLELSSLSKDERDAAVAAAVALCVLEGCSREVKGSDGTIFLLNSLLAHRPSSPQERR